MTITAFQVIRRNFWYILCPMLYTLAYPEISAEHRALIDTIRNAHDACNADIIAPHVTLAFGAGGIEETLYKSHVSAIARQTRTIPFHIRYAGIGHDPDKGLFHVFLIPDEGYSALSRLHDRLYTHVLTDHLRLDLPFVPHITVATTDSGHAAKRLAADLNDTHLSIAGYIRTLDVIWDDGTAITPLGSYPLAA